MRRFLIAFDIDGTVLSHSKNPSYVPEATREALRLLQIAGHVVAFNTARSHATAARWMRELDVVHAALCNGADIVADSKTIYTHFIDPITTKQCIKVAEDYGCTAFASDERSLYALNASQETLAYLTKEAGEVLPMERLEERACKLDIYGEFPQDLVINGNALILIEAGHLEVRPAGFAKEQGLMRLAGHFGFSQEDTIAVGDSSNDIGMLRAAGIGIAVGGAPEDVQAAASVTAGVIEEEGILEVFLQLGLI